MELLHEPGRQRYLLRDGVTIVCALDYVDDGRVVSMTRTFTNPPFRGRGHAGELVAFAVDTIESAGGRRIRPMCWYVADWFAAHPERSGLLE